ncbi:hypothetical protein N9S88_00280 [bacterium]|jgi:hypothetical protein|nr:hypothetical protein [bacterium]
MKKISLLITITFLIISCQNNEPALNKNVGEILSGNNKGSTYSIGSMEHAQLALDFSTAFVNQDYDFVTKENYLDTVFFYPEKGLDRLEFDLPSLIALAKSMHEPYDSIKRNVYDVIPVVPSYDENLTVVMFPFTETRYRKDGEIEKYRFFERHYIREGKIAGVRKWSQEE